jgi:DNA-directed RNA polymerase subunit RPC12/RpoP
MIKQYRLECIDNTEKESELRIGITYIGIISGDNHYTILSNDECDEQSYSKARFEVIHELVPIVYDESKEKYICCGCKKEFHWFEIDYAHDCPSCGAELMEDTFDLDDMEG